MHTLLRLKLFWLSIMDPENKIYNIQVKAVAIKKISIDNGPSPLSTGATHQLEAAITPAHAYRPYLLHDGSCKRGINLHQAMQKHPCGGSPLTIFMATTRTSPPFLPSCVKLQAREKGVSVHNGEE